MIGQNALRENLSNLIELDRLPRFIILIGDYGSGRKLLAKWIATTANMPYVTSELGVDNIRQIIDVSYKTTLPTVYIIPNANKLSTIAQNALLKITEEPPNLAYFIITIENGGQILPTLLNRGITFQMLPYTANELRLYLEQTYPTSKYHDILIDICDTMGEMNDLMSYDIEEFLGFVDKVVVNISTASGANAFRIADKINLKDTESESGKGYDLSIFLKAFKAHCMNALMNDTSALKYADGVVVTNKYLQDLQRIRGVNKPMLFDAWLIDVRKRWV